jgi:biopolymer transport protein ExbD
MGFTQREARAIIRKAVNRVPEGEEIRHLNIMPMMDMMTILLVVAIFQSASSATELQTPDLNVPESKSDESLPADASTLIISKRSIVVSVNGKAKTIVSVANGDVSPADKEGGAQGRKIPKLTSFLANLRSQEDALRKQSGGNVNPTPELLVLADRTTPYNLLVEVMFSAKQKEAGYKRFRLIVQKQFAPTSEK